MDLKQHAYEYFRLKGFADHQAAALAAHMDQESGGNTRAIHDKGTGLGIFGWRDPEEGKGRKTDLINWAKTAGPGRTALDPHALNTQLDFAVHELNTSEKAAGDKLRSAKTYQDAINAGMSYLRPAGYTPDNPYGGHNYTGRYNAGAQLAGVQPLVGGAVAAAGGDTAPPVATAATTPSLLAPSTPIDTSAAQAAVDKARQEKEAGAEYDALTKSGMGLLEKATPRVQPVAPMAMSDGFHIPEAKPVALPNYRQQAQAADPFTQVLMQQRLQRRI